MCSALDRNPTVGLKSVRTRPGLTQSTSASPSPPCTRTHRAPPHPQAFLTKLLTVDLPALMTLPSRLEINIPPAVTAVAEAAVGRDAVMRAVASAVLQVRVWGLGLGGECGGIRGAVQVRGVRERDFVLGGWRTCFIKICLGFQKKGWGLT